MIEVTYDTTSYLEKTRTAYDIVAVDYQASLRDSLSEATWDRAMLDGFAEVVDGPVLDVGCGPGRITGYLAGLGLQVSGLDLSPAMVDLARATCPGIEFEVGSLLDIPRAGGSLDGLVAWYSLVHTPPELLPVAFAEFYRVLGHGGSLLTAFQVGDGRHPVGQGYGHAIDLDVYSYPIDLISRLAARAGFLESVRLARAPEAHERQPQGYLQMTKP